MYASLTINQTQGTQCLLSECLFYFVHSSVESSSDEGSISDRNDCGDIWCIFFHIDTSLTVSTSHHGLCVYLVAHRVSDVA